MTLPCRAEELSRLLLSRVEREGGWNHLLNFEMLSHRDKGVNSEVSPQPVTFF